MRVVNVFIVGVLICLPLLWMAVVSVSLYLAIASVYQNADRTAQRVAYGH